MVVRFDPLSKGFYEALFRAESFQDAMFVIMSTTSILSPVLTPDQWPLLSPLVRGIFFFCTLISFLVGSFVKFRVASRARNARIGDLLSHSFQRPIAPQTSSGYYNNAENHSIRRLAASVLENTLFSREIIRSMLKWVRVRYSAYFLVWSLAVYNSGATLGIVAIIAQVLFSEQVFSRWIRMEWLSNRFEESFQNMYDIIEMNSDPEEDDFKARVIQILVKYEADKAQAAISLSSRTFTRLNPSVTDQWRLIGQRLRIK